MFTTMVRRSGISLNIDVIVKGVVRIADKGPKANPSWTAEHASPSSSLAPFKLNNIGNHNPVKLIAMIEKLERALDKKAAKYFLPFQPGDVAAT